MSSKVSSTGGRPESRMSANSNDGLEIDVLIEEAVQFMDEPLRGKLQLKGLVAPVEQVTISLTGVVKTHNAGSAGWASGFGGESNVNMRFSEREVGPPPFAILYFMICDEMLIVDFETRDGLASNCSTSKSPPTWSSPLTPLRLPLPRQRKITT